MTGGKTKERFSLWLAQNAPSDRVKRIILSCEKIEEYCHRNKLLDTSLFEVTDLDALAEIRKETIETVLFQVLYKKQLKALISAFEYYVAFVKASAVEKSEVSVTNGTSGLSTESLGGLFAENISGKEDSLPEKFEEKNICEVDFSNIPSFAYTKPVSFSYFGDEYSGFKGWAGLYVRVLKCLYEDYPDTFQKMVNTNITGGNRIDFAEGWKSKTMTKPSKICDNFYAEINLSATYIVLRIRILLDQCNVDYENLEIKYEKRTPITKAGTHSTPQTANTSNDNNSKITENDKSEEKREATIDYSPVDGNHATYIESFRNWLIYDQHMTDKSAQSYASAITNCEQLANKLHLNEVFLYGADFSTVEHVKKQLEQTEEYKEVNKRQHNRYKAAIEQYKGYLQNKSEQKSFGSVAKNEGKSPVTPHFETPAYNKNIENVLEQCFVKGFRLGSKIEMEKFKREYVKINGISVNVGDDIVEKSIQDCGIIYQNKVFLPKTMLSDSIKEKLCSYIDSTFASGKDSIYFDPLFKEFSDEFLGNYIYNAEMLRAYLLHEYGDKYNIGKNQIFKEAGVITDPVKEVCLYLKSYGKPMNKSDLYKALAHLPKSKIDGILNGEEFIRNSKGEYFHVDMMKFSTEELEDISALIEDVIDSRKFISGTELMNAIRAKYPFIYEGYSGYSDLGWRNVLKYRLGNKFSFKGNIISRSGVTLSMNDVFGQLAAEADTITIDQLLAFAKDMGSSVIYFDAVYQNALRINETTFVSRDRAAFQVDETDTILDRFCVGNYVSLADFKDFGIFPDAGFPWTVYLLESYVAFYSDRYSLKHGGYNRNCAVGAVVKKSAGYESFDDLLVDVIADSSISFKETEALDFLVNAGYTARRSYKNIAEIVIKAKAKKNGKGRL